MIKARKDAVDPEVHRKDHAESDDTKNENAQHWREIAQYWEGKFERQSDVVSETKASMVLLQAAYKEAVKEFNDVQVQLKESDRVVAVSEHLVEELKENVRTLKMREHGMKKHFLAHVKQQESTSVSILTAALVKAEEYPLTMRQGRKCTICHGHIIDECQILWPQCGHPVHVYCFGVYVKAMCHCPGRG